MKLIHQLRGWPRLTWDREVLSCPLADVRHKQGRLLGRMEALGFDLRREACLVVLTSDVVKSSAIEGEALSPEEVRSSIARRMGLDVAGVSRTGRDIEGIVDMALARADRTKERFYSMSSQLAADRKEYYRELELAQRGDLDITRWLMWFLHCLDRAISNADELLGAVIHKAKLWTRINLQPVNNRQRLVINRMPDEFQGFLTNSKYATLAQCSSDTALRDIRELLARTIVRPNEHGGRSTSYRLGEPDEIVE